MVENLDKIEVLKGNVDGEIIEITTKETVRVISKEDLLAEKNSELDAHYDALEKYIASMKNIENNILKQIKDIEDAE
jgi:hypothetical protein